MTTTTKEQFINWTPADVDTTYIGKIIFDDADGCTIETSTGDMFIPMGDGEITVATKKAFTADMKKVDKFIDDVMAKKPAKKKAPAKKKVATKKGPSKIDIAIGIYTKATEEGRDRAYIIEQFMTQMDVSKGNAGTYIHDVKRKMAKIAVA